MLLVMDDQALDVQCRANIVPGAQTSIIQNLSYFEHLSEPMAEFLHILSEQYDYPQLADEVLRYALCFQNRRRYIDKVMQ